jgi:hypothetical protein
MKHFFCILFVIVSAAIFAQAPKQIPYQGVARNATGTAVANQSISLRLTIEEGPGIVLFQEVHEPITNAFGLFNVQIGSIELMEIDWSGSMKYLHVEMDITGGTNYVDLGTTAFLSVPYALYAESSGTPGPQGEQGPAGPAGATGPQGEQGPVGPMGMTGPQGAAGINGIDGQDGAQGPAGPQGIQGEQGLAGPMGMTGPQGAAGINGMDGQDGALGPAGPQGIQGEQGPVGPMGMTGPQGLVGINGIDGQDGQDGEQGPAGPQGIQGEQGPVGPMGMTGPQGAAGINGIDGQDGQDGVQGPAGPQGIQGEQGPVGPMGMTGPQGPIGLTGPAGTTGATGPAGATGATGPQGPIGLTGPAGPTGQPGNGYSNGTVENQINYWNGSSWVLLDPGQNGESLTICNNQLTWTFGGLCPEIATLNCSNAAQTGEITMGNPINGVFISIPYDGGNGATYNALSIPSNDVTGLTASTSIGNLNTGNGQIDFVIAGSPSNAGIANFLLNFAGQSCSFSIVVSPNLTGTYRTGTVHCGTPALVVDITSPATGKIWMDRNLGASQVASSFNDVNAYGDLYQWGRFADGHQCRTSLTTNNLSSSDQPGTNRFIIGQFNPWDWRNPQNPNLWQGEMGINNPCPMGYRIPTGAEFDAENLSWGGTNNMLAFASPLKLTAGGSRVYNTGNIISLGSIGNYWTSSLGNITGLNSAAFTHNSSSGGTTSGSPRSAGFSVRCIKD